MRSQRLKSLLATPVRERPGIAVAFLAILVALSVLAAWSTARGFLSHASVYDVGFGFGRMVRHLIVEGRYGDYLLLEQVVDGKASRLPIAGRSDLWGVAHRLPFIPLYLSAVALFVESAAAHFFVKNAIFFGLSAWAVLRTARVVNARFGGFLFFAALVLAVPYNAIIASSLDFEEGYIFHLVVALFALFASEPRLSRVIGAGVAIFVLALTKSSMLMASAWAALAFAAARPWRASALVPAALLAAALVLWGGFTWRETGHFAFGATMSSWNGWNLYKGNNERVKDLYPAIELDALDVEGFTQPNRPITDEWDLNRYYRERTREFITEHPGEWLRNAGKKIYVAFVGIQPVALEHPDEASESWLKTGSMIADRVVLALALAAAVATIGAAAAGRGTIPWRPALFYLGFVAAYALPYVLGFVYYRHMVPCFGLSALFLFWWTSVREA